MISFKIGVMPKYAPRFDYDGWMVVNTAVHDGELVDEPLRRGLSFAEAERSAAFFNRRCVRHPAHRNCPSELSEHPRHRGVRPRPKGALT